VKKKYIRRAVLHSNGEITYIEVPYDKVLKEIRKLLEEDKLLLEILEKL